MSIRMAIRPANSGVDLLARRWVNVNSLEQCPHGVAWLCANAQPILDAISLEAQLLVISNQRIEPTKLLDDSAIAGCSFVHRIESVKGTMPASQTLQSKYDHMAPPVHCLLLGSLPIS
jgi:hypothetical protein